MIKYQGDDIEFNIELEKIYKGDVESFNNFVRIVLYAYTDECFVAKFSSQYNFYNKLNIISPTLITGVIKSLDTMKMRGNLFFDIMFESESHIGDLLENSIKRINTGIQIINTPIKNEI